MDRQSVIKDICASLTCTCYLITQLPAPIAAKIPGRRQERCKNHVKAFGDHPVPCLCYPETPCHAACRCSAGVPARLQSWPLIFSPPQLSVGENLGIL